MPSNSSESDSNLRFPSDRQVEPSHAGDPRTRPLGLPLLWGALGVLVQIRLCYWAGRDVSWQAIIPLVSGLTLILGGMALRREKIVPSGTSPRYGRILLLGGAVVGFAAGVPFGLWALGAALLLLFSNALSQRLAFIHDLVIAILAASVFLGTATALNGILLGGYPAAFAFFFFLAWSATLAVETCKDDLQNRRLTLATLVGPRAALVTSGILFFIFGIITTWPFLRESYSSTYFWFIAIGVDLPLLWMWGKLRGRDKQLSESAIVKFNQRARWLTFVILLALLFA